MSWRANCPSCGSPVEFGLGTSVLVICEACRSAVVREGANVADLGKVATLVPTPSRLQLGIAGTIEGKRFDVVGRVQLDHGAGTWDEWRLVYSDGSSAWLSESQGKFHLMEERILPPLPPFSDHDPGETVDLGADGTFVVQETRRASYVAAAGELEHPITPGGSFNYVDVAGPRRAFGTLDYGDGETAQAVYVGREIRLPDLGFSESDLVGEDESALSATADSLNCPNCGGPIDLQAPDETQRVGCPYCGSLLDATNDFAILAALDGIQYKPRIPLGSKGRLSGREWTVIGHLTRSVTVDYIRYGWFEYLLYSRDHGYRWLVESKGHWAFVEPLGVADVTVRMGGARYGGDTFKHFQSGLATVDQVLGEFYWQVAAGDTANTVDYVKPPWMLSKETTDDEVAWSLGTYLESDEVWSAFVPPGEPPLQSGVAPNQPWKKQQRFTRARSAALKGIAALLLLYVLFGLRSRTEHLGRHQLDGADVSGRYAVGQMKEVGPFEVRRRGNLQLRFQAPLSNSWLFVEGSIVEQATEQVIDFSTEVAYYSGVSGGESWSEGSKKRSVVLPAMTPGKYLVLLRPQWQKGRNPGYFDLRVKSGHARFRWVVLGILAMVAYPLFLGMSKFSFEQERWSESDHPWSSE